jgi:hypothetical protein
MKKLIIVLLIASTSCTPVYIPNLRNAPMFVKGGEFQASFHGGNGLDFQTALSVTKNIGVIGNYSYLNRESPDNTTKYRRHLYYEGGLGYFVNDKDMVFEIFAGYGKGEGSSYASYWFISSQKIQATGKYERYFIQPTFGFNKKTFHAGFVPRFSYVDFTEFSDGTTTFIDDRKGIFFFEPAFVGKVNGMNNRVFFTFQTGFSVPMIEDNYFDYRPFQMAIGFGFRLGGNRDQVSEAVK